MLFTRRNAAKWLGGGAALSILPGIARAQDIRNGASQVAFYFSVNFAGALDTDAVAFMEVGGISAEMGVIIEDEGGENRFVRALPRGVKNPTLVLTRGVAAIDSAFVKWCKSVLESDQLAAPIVTRDINVSLLDNNGAALRSWQFRDAWPAKWQISPIVSDNRDVALERVSLSYARSRRSF